MLQGNGRTEGVENLLDDKLRLDECCCFDNIMFDDIAESARTKSRERAGVKVTLQKAKELVRYPRNRGQCCVMKLYKIRVLYNIYQTRHPLQDSGTRRHIF